MDRKEKDTQYLDPAPFRDRLEVELRKLGATSEKRAISLASVGQWSFRCKAKLTATLLSDPRFIVSHLGALDAVVHVLAQPTPALPEKAIRSSLFAGASVLNHVPSAPLAVFTLDDCSPTSEAGSVPAIGKHVDQALRNCGGDESSSEHAEDRVKRPLKPSEKRRKIRKIRSDNALPVLTREAHQKELDRIIKQKELDEIERLKKSEIDEIIDISSSDEAVSAHPISSTRLKCAAEFVPLVCTVASDRFVVDLEADLVGKLKAHQLEGVKFMWGHLSNAEGFGCILADEMGLGKTLTSLVTLHALSLATVCRHALVVCPSLVISTWIEQTEKWLPSSSAINRLCVISPEVPIAKRFGKLQSWAEAGGLCIIGYEMFREVCAQPDSPSAVLLTATPNVVVVDEGHRLKSESAKITQALHLIKTKRRLSLTGYPLQNKPMEYFHMVDFVRPAFLGTCSDFTNRFERPIANGQCDDSSDVDKEISRQQAALLHDLLDSVVLRRTHAQAGSEIPPKIEVCLFLRCSEMQMRVHNALVEACRNGVLRNNPIDLLPLVRQLSGHPLFLASRCAKALKRATGSAVLEIDDASEVSDIDDDDEKREQKKFSPTVPVALPNPPSMSPLVGDYLVNRQAAVGDTLRHGAHESLPTIPHNFGSLRSLAHNCESLLKERPSPLHHEISMIERISYVSQKVMLEVQNCDRHACSELRAVENYVVGNRYSCIIESGPDTHVKVPCTLVGVSDGSCEVDAEVRVGDEVVLNRLKVHRLEELLPLESILFSGKMCVVLQIVAAAEASGEKVLIFSQSLHVLAAIESMLLESAESASNPNHVDVMLQGIPPNMRWRCGQIFTINGGTPFKDRIKNVQLFAQAKPGAVMLLGKLAAKEGITLTSASRVILMDVSFNPSNDLQASSRAHRFGQERPVYVYRLIQDGTLERAVYDRQVVKQQTFLRVVDDKNPLEYGLKKDLVASMNKLCRNAAKLPGVNNIRPPCNFPENLTDDRVTMKLQGKVTCRFLSRITNHSNLLNDEAQAKSDAGSQVSDEKRKMAMGFYIDQKNAMEIAISSGKTVFTGPQAAAFNAMRMNGTIPAIQLPAADGARALPSTFPPHVRATALIGASTMVSNGPSSCAQNPVKSAASSCDVQVITPTTRPLPFHPTEHTNNIHSSHLPSDITFHDQQLHPKPLLSFHSSLATYDPTFRATFRRQQQAQSVPLLPTSALMSADPSHFDKMLKEWSHNISQQSHGQGAAARVSQPSVFHVEADDDVLCINSPISNTCDSRAKAEGVGLQNAVNACAGDSDEIICVSSEDESLSEVHNATTPLLGPQMDAAEADSTANSTGETKPPTCSVTPRGIMNFFSPITKKTHEGLPTSSAGSPRALHSSPNGTVSSSAIPLIVNPIFTEVQDNPPATSSVTEVRGNPARTSSVTLSSPTGDGDTFSVVISMISGKTLSLVLPKDLLQNSSTPMNESRGPSPVEDPSPLMRALQLAMEQQHAVPRIKIAKFLVAGENLTHMTREKFATMIRRSPPPEILVILKL